MGLVRAVYIRIISWIPRNGRLWIFLRNLKQSFQVDFGSTGPIQSPVDAPSLQRIEDLTKKFRIQSVKKSSLEMNIKEFDLHIIVPTFNSIETVKETLASLKIAIDNNSTWKKIEVTVVDDYSIPWIQNELSHVVAEYQFKLTLNPFNMGFGRNCNEAVKILESNNVLLLNSDIEVQPQFLNKVFEMWTVTNAALITVPSFDTLIQYGFEANTWQEMNQILSAEPEVNFINACTAIGYALLIDLEQITLPLFDLTFGRGYGEDSDLHYRVVEYYGSDSVVALNQCVKHLGGESFRNISDSYRTELRKIGLEKFRSKWGDVYDREITFFQSSIREYSFKTNDKRSAPKARLCVVTPNISKVSGGQIVLANLALSLNESQLNCYLHSVSDLALHSTYMGAISVGGNRLSGLGDEANFVYLIAGGNAAILEVEDFVSKTKSEIFKKILVLQGNDFWRDPTHWKTLTSALATWDYVLANSSYTAALARFYRQSEVIEFSMDIEYSQPKFLLNSPSNREHDLVIPIRNGNAKGAWLGASVAAHFKEKGKKVLLIAGDSSDYINYSDYESVICPNPKSVIEALANCRVLFDPAIEEGYGLMSREALLSGCNVVAINNGGNEDLRGFDQVRLHEVHDFIGISKSIEELTMNTNRLVQLPTKGLGTLHQVIESIVANSEQ
jgi:GT2 family glycosyltransferase